MNTLSKNVAILSLTVITISSGGAFAMIQDDQAPQITDDGAKIFGHIELVARDANGEIKAYRQTDNLVVTEGLGCTSDLMFGTSHCTGEVAGGFTVIGVGTGTSGPAAGDTDIQTQASSKRLDSAAADSGSNGAVIETQWLANTLKNGTGTTAITESALFDSTGNATGNIFARQTFTAINIGVSDTLTVTWTITFAST